GDPAKGGGPGHHIGRRTGRRNEDHRPDGSVESQSHGYQAQRSRHQGFMKLHAGTSGYAFKEWKGNFYPQELKDDGMLGYYASKFPTVEINNTFYRLPRENVLREWAAQVPENFTFALKASQRITHYARLKEESASLVDFLLKNTALLGDRLGPILFQL